VISFLDHVPKALWKVQKKKCLKTMWLYVAS